MYEDENDNYNYEKGAFSTIKLQWSNQTKIVTIGKRKGSFNGMIKNRTFNIVFVDKEKGTGVTTTSKFNKTMTYNGKAKSVKL